MLHLAGVLTFVIGSTFSDGLTLSDGFGIHGLLKFLGLLEGLSTLKSSVLVEATNESQVFVENGEDTHEEEQCEVGAWEVGQMLQ